MKPFIPETLPLKNLNWDKLRRLLSKASLSLGEYKGILQSLPNPVVLLSPLSTQEAVFSSRIEGTEATLKEVLEYEVTDEAEDSKKQDIREIINYRQATYEATNWLLKKPISLNLLKKIHFILMDSVRGKDKRRGEFRREQNHIGPPGSPIEKATYVPPPPNVIMEHMSNFEKYIHYDEKDKLVQLAIVHAQFEIIHPFLDGNGRLGRILIPLFLYEKKLLEAPTFYISNYLESHRDEYIDCLNNISKDGDWNAWIEFFLKAIDEQSKLNTSKVKQIHSLHDHLSTIIPNILQSKYSMQIIELLFNTPFFTSTEFINKTGMSKKSASRILHSLNENNIIDILKIGKGRRPTLWAFTNLLTIVDS